MSFPRYPSYRESGIDWFDTIPAHWGLERLRHLVTLNPSKSEIGDMPDDMEVTFLPMEAISETGEIDVTRTRPLAELKNGYTYFADGDLVFAKVTPCFENGKGALIEGLVAGCGFGTTELTVLRTLAAADAQFLRWLIFSDLFRGPGSGEMLGAGGLKRVPDGFVADFPVPWPSASERQTISAFLECETAKIDALVEEQRRLVELLKEKRQAVISQAVTKGLDPTVPMKASGVEWLGDMPEHWEVSPMKRLASIRYGIGEPPTYQQSGTPLIRATNVDAGKILAEGMVFVDPDDIPVKRVVWLQEGDIIVVRSGAHTGDSAIITPGHCPAIAGFDMVLRPLRCEPMYLQYALLAAYLEQGQIAVERMRAAQPHLNAEELGSCMVAVPPEPEQQRVVQFLGSMTAEIDLLSRESQKTISLLAERRAALISAAVTGEIDVRSAAPQRAEAA